jgi:acetyl esterase
MSKLDSDAQAVVDQVVAAGIPPINTLVPQNARMLPDIAQAAMGVLGSSLTSRTVTPFPEPVSAIAHQVIPSNGRSVVLRVYTPNGTGPFPVLVYTHGGGFVIFDLDTYDATCRALCNAAECVVVSVGYHQAPEHPFPAAPEDAFAAYLWVLNNAASINGDPSRIAVGGESAGGNLATVTALQARDKGVKLPIFQLLVYPMTNAAFDTPSYQEHADAKPLNKPLMQWFWGHYLASPADAANPYVSPLRAASLSGLPPALVITAEVDPLRSEGEAYAMRLREAGVPVVHKHYTGVMHEFFSMPAVIDKAKEAVNDAAKALKQAFEGNARVAGA